MSETHRYILFYFSQYVTSSGMLGGKCAEFIPSKASQIIDITDENEKIIGEDLTTKVIIALDTMSDIELLESQSPSPSRSRSRSRSRYPLRSRSRYGSRSRSRS